MTVEQQGSALSEPAEPAAAGSAGPSEDGTRGLQDLLRIQEIDVATDRLLARQALLEGGADVAKARQELMALEAAAGGLQLTIDEVSREHQRLEHDIDSMDRKRRDEEKRLNDGSVANPKELQSIQAEVDNIAARKVRMEDRLLELMEQREDLDARFAAAREEATTARTNFDELTKGSGDELDEIDRSLASSAAAREAIVPSVDEDLLALYEVVRRQKKGVGIAELRDGVCQGCHQKLSPMELDRMKRASGVRRCDYCRRILVLA